MLEASREEFLEQGFVILRDVIPPDEREEQRRSQGAKMSLYPRPNRPTGPVPIACPDASRWHAVFRLRVLSAPTAEAR